jgi:hypothetical protein
MSHALDLNHFAFQEKLDVANRIFPMSEHAMIGSPEWAQPLRDSHRDIWEEYDTFTSRVHGPDPSEESVGLHASCVDRHHKWHALCLRLYGVDTDYAAHFPRTMELLRGYPVESILFSVMRPGAELTPHRGVYRGILRYHLGLRTPPGDGCRLSVRDENGELQHHVWRDGEDVVFDDMYEHGVRNDTELTRVVLFVDLRRHFGDAALDRLNDQMIRSAQSNEILQSKVRHINDRLRRLLPE